MAQLPMATHTPLHISCPTAQPPTGVIATVQTPPVQACPAWHAVPHAPQFKALVVTSVHWPPHACWPTGHPQVPFEQAWPAGHTMPQPPQFVGLLVMFVQLAPQVMVPPGQVAEHVPLAHTRPCAAQSLPHAPQLLPSDVVSTQLVPHASRPGEHMHVPPLQVVCAGHALPQAPQLFTSVLVLAQPLAHCSAPPGQDEHIPLLHWTPAGHALPHAPQCCAVLFRKTQKPSQATVPA
jgi:hypothetical protein